MLLKVDDVVEGGAEVNKQDPGVGSWGVQMLEDEMEGQVDRVVYGPVGSVGELQGVQVWSGDGPEVWQDKALKGLHDYRGQRDGSEVVFWGQG